MNCCDLFSVGRHRHGCDGVRPQTMAEYHRDEKIRLVVSQQWAVAITVCGDSIDDGNDAECPATTAHYRDRIDEVAALPCAVDVVDEQ